MKNKETRSCTAIHERAVETGVASKMTTASTYEFTTSTSPRQRISRFLGYGVENGVTLRELAALTGWPERDIRLAIRAERMAGTMIISDNAHGYYLTDDPAEAQRFARSMRRRAAEIGKVAQAVEEAMGLD